MKCRVWLVRVLLLCAWLAGCGAESGQQGVCEGAVLEMDEGFSGEVHWKSVVSGAAHSCGLTREGKVYCWGGNTYGQLGHCSSVDMRTVVRVGGEHVFVRISAGDYHTVGLTEQGEVYGWGRNQAGQLGDGTTQDRIRPVRVVGDLEFAMISAGANHTLALTREGKVYGWGMNDSGQVGNGTLRRQTRPVPVQMKGDVSFSAISAGGRHSLGLTQSGRLYSWGSNDAGQLGICLSVYEACAVERSPGPMLVAGAPAFGSISAGARHSVGVTREGKAYGWGDNQYGQVGREVLYEGAEKETESEVVQERYFSPVRIAKGYDFRSLSAGASHTAGITQEGKAYSWGSNLFGQLGDRTRLDRDVPGQVVGYSFLQVSAGGYHTVGLTQERVLYGWGNGFGRGGELEQPRTVRVSGLEVRY